MFITFELQGSQQVDYKWSGVGFGEFLVSNYGIAYASIDGRGTGFQSDDFTFELYEKLGTVEMEVSCIQKLAPIRILITYRK